ncbi:tetratricopeptide repeat protein [Metaclostridioides mangenotii]|uniref:tetratricopeptide repeat protein n=1 Tax=Metaclostridioides mangenotii TaxID=1540 RepID=UPI0005716582|nr:tetratricopeptide repeat protein [Clostridioides mangenotii]
MIEILGIDIIADIKNMQPKELDISLIEVNEDLTFFKVKNEEEDKISRILLESLITENIKKETLDSLEFTASDDIREISDEKILKSYELYNNALSLASVNYITGAEKLIDKAYKIYNRDVDILNLRGIIKLLKCDFSQSFNSFYISSAYKDVSISKKYIDIFTSDEFEVFLERYNHAVRFINEGLNYEAIEILENLVEEEPEFLNPYVMLSLMFNKIDKYEKSNLVLDKLRYVDRDNEVVQKRSLDIEMEEDQKIKAVSKYKSDKKSDNKTWNSPKLVIGISIVALLAIVFVYNNNSKIDDLNNKLDKKEAKLSMLEDKVNKGNGDKEAKKDTEKETDKEISKKLSNKDEDDLFENAFKLRKVEDYKGAINYFQKIVDNGNRKKYISESMYQLAVLNSKIKNDDEAIKYYKKYINTYSKNDTYYDDSYYELGMMYYKNGDLKNAKKTFYSLKSEVPDSMYNNSKIKEILKEN